MPPLTSASSLFMKIDADGNGSLTLAEMSCRLSDFGLLDEQIEQLFYALDTNNDGVVSSAEFEAGFGKVEAVVSGSAAVDFKSGPVKQWGFTEWKLDRWLAFNGSTIQVFSSPRGPDGQARRPPPGQKALFAIEMAGAKCNVDPAHANRFSIDTGTSSVHFMTHAAAVRQDWCEKFAAAGVQSARALADVVAKKKRYKLKVGAYYLGEVIGAGGFAKVHCGVKAETGEAVAAKRMAAKALADPAHKKEIVAMAALKHPNIVELKDIVYVPAAGRSGGGAELFLMLELAPGGELFSRVCDEGALDEPTARFYFRQMLEGCMYCHARGICHRDLKLENLLLVSEGKGGGEEGKKGERREKEGRKALPPCCLSLAAVPLPCRCLAAALLLPCGCRAAALPLPCGCIAAALLPRFCLPVPAARTSTGACLPAYLAFLPSFRLVRHKHL
eukprot:SAG22_NODE_1646_length_3900_cov_8.380952_2_plen_444_part_00